MKPLTYAIKEIEAGRHPEMMVDGLAGRFWLTDRDWRPLTCEHFTSRTAAEAKRTRVLDTARRSIGRETN